MFATQQSRIEKDKALVQGAGGLSEADRFQHQDPYVAWQSVKAQAENLATAVGGFTAAAAALNATSEALAATTRVIEHAPGKAEAALAEHEAARKRGEDVMLAPSNIARLNDLLGDPSGNTTPEMAQARQEKLQRDAIDAARARLDGVKASRQHELDMIENGSWYQRAGMRALGATPDSLRARIADITQQRADLDAAVKAMDDTREKLDEATMARQGANTRFGQHNAGQAVNPVGAFGLHGAAGMDDAPQFGGQQQAPAGPMTVPLPPARPTGIGEAAKPLSDLKDVLGGGADALSPIIAKAGEAKIAVEAISTVNAKPTVDTASIAAATAQAQMLLSVLQSIPGAAGSAIAAANGAAGAVNTLRARAGARASFSDGVTPGRGAE